MVLGAGSLTAFLPEETEKETACRLFDEMVQAHQRRVYNVCYRLLSDAHAAEDATQETFVAAWRQLWRREPIGITWLLHVATNKCRDELRRRKRHAAGRLDSVAESDRCPTAPGPGPEGAAIAGQAEADLARAIARLPWHQRTCLVLADIEGMRYEAIAAATGASLGTVKSRIYRARRRLRLLLAEAQHPWAGAA